MKTVKVADLTGAALDWAVAAMLDRQHSEGRVIKICRVEATAPAWIERENYAGSAPIYHRFTPSSDWAQGGPIVEREDISCRKYHRPDSPAHGTWYARICRENGTMVGWYKTTGSQQTGPTPLIAAMRCYVASKLGDTIEIPEELS